MLNIICEKLGSVLMISLCRDQHYFGGIAVSYETCNFFGFKAFER